MTIEFYKNVVIGFGKGGKTLAKMLATRGESVALIEESVAMYGGTCINVGCIPSKSLVVQAAKGRLFSEAVVNKNALIEKLRDKNYHMIADEKNAEVIVGKARFISNEEIEVLSPKPRRIKGERIFINTGSVPVLPPIVGLSESKNVVTSKEIMELTALPEHLVIIGSGYIGLEFASMFNSFGAKVTVLDSNFLLPREDGDIAARICQEMKKSGITFQQGVAINKITDVGEQAELSFCRKGEASETIRADKVLVATGRKPNTEELGLENTSIGLTERGAIKVDDHLRTSVPNIWAIGDVHGGLQFTYTSLDDFRIIENQLFGEGFRKLSDRVVVPYSVFISPALSCVGLTEKEAQRRGRQYRLFKLETSAVPKAHILNDPRGLYKALVDPITNEILGAAIYAEESYELINLVALAMRAKIPYTLLRDQLYTHPTMGEALNDLFKG